MGRGVAVARVVAAVAGARVCSALLMAVAVAAAACGSGARSVVSARGAADVTVDGSSTVFPISEAVAEEFRKVHPSIRVTVGISGTGGGFQKFCHGETDIAEASRPIAASEISACGSARVEFIELPIAYDGIAIVTHPHATWIEAISVAELRRIWEPSAQGGITRWVQVRSSWPDRELHLFGAGIDSGTFDYFTRAITGVSRASRGDFTSSEDDNVLVQGVANDPFALGFVPFSYVQAHRDRLKVVPIDPGHPASLESAVMPTPETVRSGAYRPLSRPVFVYVSKQASAREPVQRFVEFYLAQADLLAREVHAIGLGPSLYRTVQQRFTARTSGSIFSDAAFGLSVEHVLLNAARIP